MKIKILICAVSFLLLSISSGFASWEKKPEFRWLELYRADLRDSDHQFYANRLSATFNFLDKKEKSLFKVIPFFEARRNFERDVWERIELGVEVGKDILPWLYVGQSIQSTWLKEDYRQYTYRKSRDAAESETRLMLSYNLLDCKNIKLKGFILGEYTYDFDLGASTRNEVAIGLTTPVGKFIETTLNWRHVDRIHDFDSDTVEGELTLIF